MLFIQWTRQLPQLTIPLLEIILGFGGDVTEISKAAVLPRAQLASCCNRNVMSGSGDLTGCHGRNITAAILLVVADRLGKYAVGLMHGHNI